jgi:hypothetical protein
MILLRAVAFYLLLYVALIGVTCYRHGDRGPYPELEYGPYVPAVALVLAILTRGRDAQRML